MTGALGLGTGGLSWAGGLSPNGRRGPPGWPRMWWRGSNGANPGMVPPRGVGSDSRSRTYGMDALSGGSGKTWHCDGSGGGCMSRHGGCRRA